MLLKGCDARKVSIYAPYVIINKTLLDLSYKATSMAVFHRAAAGQTSLPKVQSDKDVVPMMKPLMFSFLSKEGVRGRVSVKCEYTDWSHSISLDAVGSTFEVQMKIENSTCVSLGCQVSTGSGKVCIIYCISFKFVVLAVKSGGIYATFRCQ